MILKLPLSQKQMFWAFENDIFQFLAKFENARFNYNKKWN